MSFIRSKMSIVRIECWSIIDYSNDPFLAPEANGICLRGQVYGHPDKPDEKFVKTSMVKEVQGNKVFTLNSIYELGEPDPDFIKWMEMEGLSFDPENPIKLKTING